MLSPTFTFATCDFVAKLDVGPRVGGPVGSEQHWLVFIFSRFFMLY